MKTNNLISLVAIFLCFQLYSCGPKDDIVLDISKHSDTLTIQRKFNGEDEFVVIEVDAVINNLGDTITQGTGLLENESGTTVSTFYLSDTGYVTDSVQTGTYIKRLSSPGHQNKIDTLVLESNYYLPVEVIQSS